MTNQEIFNKVLAHLRTQGRASTSNTNMSCLYRGPDGDKCAVGCLIPDDKYDPAMEGRRAEDVLGEWPDALGFPATYYTLELLRYLQCAHDQYMPTRHDPADLSRWENMMATTALQHRLDYAPQAQLQGAGDATQ